MICFGAFCHKPFLSPPHLPPTHSFTSHILAGTSVAENPAGKFSALDRQTAVLGVFIFTEQLESLTKTAKPERKNMSHAATMCL